MSDFKSTEYANLIGGPAYEPHEENPMIGFRGASRYLEPSFRDCLNVRLGEVGMQFNLVHGRDNVSRSEQPLEVVRHEVADADGPVKDLPVETAPPPMRHTASPG